MPSPGAALATVLIIGAVAACNPAAPAPVKDVPPTTGGAVPQPVRLAGTVRSAAYQPLADVKVEVLDGESAGASTTTNAVGIYVLNGAFSGTETVRASKEGYESVTREYISGSDFLLKSTTPAVELRGNYTLTIVADPSCTKLDEPLRTRTYTAQIDGFGQVSGAQFLNGWNEFAAYRDGNNVTFSTEFDGSPWLVERLTDNSYLAFHGVAYVEAATPLTTMSSGFTGYIEHCVNAAMDSHYACRAPGQAVARCDSSNHRFTLVRR